jgi:hypothetical protein
VLTTATGTIAMRAQISGQVVVTTTLSGSATAMLRVSGIVVVVTTAYGHMTFPFVPGLPTDLPLYPSGPNLPLTGYVPELVLDAAVERLPVWAEAEGYSLTKIAERLTLEGTH